MLSMIQVMKRNQKFHFLKTILHLIITRRDFLRLLMIIISISELTNQVLA